MAKTNGTDSKATPESPRDKRRMINHLLLIAALIFLVLAAVSARNALNQKAIMAYEALAQLSQALENRSAVMQNALTLLRAYDVDVDAEIEIVLEARRKAALAANLEQKLIAERDVSKQIEKLFRVAESRYDFTGDLPFAKAKKQLAMTAEDLKKAKELADGGLRFYNAFAAGFPQSLMARWMKLPAQIKYTDPFPPPQPGGGETQGNAK